MRPLLAVTVLLALVGCSDKKRKEQELNTCTQQYPNAIRSCLIRRFHWDSTAALEAQLDDLRLRQGH